MSELYKLRDYILTKEDEDTPRILELEELIDHLYHSITPSELSFEEVSFLLSYTEESDETFNMNDTLIDFIQESKQIGKLNDQLLLSQSASASMLRQDALQNSSAVFKKSNFFPNNVRPIEVDAFLNGINYQVTPSKYELNFLCSLFSAFYELENVSIFRKYKIAKQIKEILLNYHFYDAMQAGGDISFGYCYIMFFGTTMSKISTHTLLVEATPYLVFVNGTRINDFEQLNIDPRKKIIYIFPSNALIEFSPLIRKMAQEEKLVCEDISNDFFKLPDEES